jgi:DNA ligase-1
MLDIIKELRSDNGKLWKEGVLRKHISNEEWKDYLLSVYSPFITYGHTGDKNGGREDLENLKLCRSIDAGITATTINKVYPGLIPTASKMMKALDLNKKPKKLSFPLYAGIKYDGNYTNIVVTDGTAKFYTSGGHEYTVRGNHPFTDIPDGVYMAERIGEDGRLGTRRTCNLKGSKPIQYSEGHEFKVFDCVKLGEFELGESSTKYVSRSMMLTICLALHKALEWLVCSQEELDRLLAKVVKDGYEGLVLKSPDMLWRDSKSRKVDFCKLKQRPTADLYCMEEIEGEGKNEGLIGSLRLVDSSGREVSVGSGMSESDRGAWGSFVNKVIEIEYEQIMDTYIQPTFICIRDKCIDDID